MSEGGEARNHETGIEAAYEQQDNISREAVESIVDAYLDAVRCARERDTGVEYLRAFLDGLAHLRCESDCEGFRDPCAACVVHEARRRLPAPSPQGEDHEAGDWPNVEMVRCREVGDLLHGHRCGYANSNELACPNSLPCPSETYVPAFRCSSPGRLGELLDGETK